MARKMTWREKLADDKDLPGVEKITDKMARRFGTGTVLIPAPREVDAAMRTIRKGKLTTIDLIRETLAAKHGAGIRVHVGVVACVL